LISAVYSRTARLAFRVCFSKIKNQNFEIKIIPWGAFRSLQLFISDNGVGLRTQKRSFKRVINPILTETLCNTM